MLMTRAYSASRVAHCLMMCVILLTGLYCTDFYLLDDRAETLSEGHDSGASSFPPEKGSGLERRPAEACEFTIDRDKACPANGCGAEIFHPPR